jgi:hypothetical protein
LTTSAAASIPNLKKAASSPPLASPSVRMK